MTKKLSNSIYDKYVELLSESINKNHVISEDTARYLFYANVINELKLSNKELIDIHQEVSYSNPILGLGKKTELLRKNNAGNIMGELDSYFDFGLNKYAIEFKHHRELSKAMNKKAIPHSQYAGEVFDDINRLSLIDNKLNRYFVYVMDSGMINYKKKDSNSLFRKVFDLKKDESYVIKQKELLKQSKTTSIEAYSSFINNNELNDINVKMIFRKKFISNKTEYLITVIELK